MSSETGGITTSSTTTTKRQSSMMEYLDNMDKKISKTLKQLARALYCLSKGDNIANHGEQEPINEGDFKPSSNWIKKQTRLF